MSRNKRLTITAVVGLLLLIIGIVLLVIFPTIMNIIIDKQIKLVKGTTGFKKWQDIPVPFYARIYFFNITNPDEYLFQQAKPILKEVGPYVYSSHWEKHNLTWHDNGTLSYTELRTFWFEEGMSSGFEDDLITTVNAPMVTAATILKDKEDWIKVAFSIACGLLGEKLIVQKPVRNLTFAGYKDILAMLEPFLDLPSTDGKFGWLYGKNATDDGLFTVHTGADDIEKLNVITEWNGQPKLTYWSGDTCNMINGTNGEISPPIRSNRKSISFFQSLLCRTFSLEFEDIVDHLGVPSHKFLLPASALANGTDNPDNACFNTSMNLFSGALDVGACQHGAPAVLSLPHFYLADKSYLQNVEGLQPNGSIHSFYLVLEPNTGLAMELAARFQISLNIKEIDGIVQLTNITELVFPAIWIDISISVDEANCKQLRFQLIELPIIVKVLSAIILVIGAVTSSVSLTLLFYGMYSKKNSREGPNDDDPLLDPGKEEPSKRLVVNGSGDNPSLE